MPPALTIVAQVVLGILVGAIGVAVATPLVAALMSAIRMTYVEGTLEGDPPGTARARKT
jgi:predicted PurR-regulated permease PerM